MTDEIYKLKEDEQINLETGQPKALVSHETGWVTGVALIVVGMGLLMNRSLGFGFENWWAVFILIPAISSFGQAWKGYQRSGRFDDHTRNALMGGVFVGFIALVFLFGLSWGLMWPLALIFVGICAITSGKNEA